MYIYIYIYIYIYTHTHTGFSLYISKFAVYRYIFICCYRLPECSIHEKSFAFMCRWQPAIPRLNAHPTGKSVYIVIHRQIALLYHNSSVWLDTGDPSSWDPNPADSMSIGYLTPELSISEGILLVHIHMYGISNWNTQFIRRVLYLYVCCRWKSLFDCLTHWGWTYLYIYKLAVYSWMWIVSSLFNSYNTKM